MDHPDTLSTIHGLASLLGDQGGDDYYYYYYYY
jgi:hypothetical protein